MVLQPYCVAKNHLPYKSTLNGLGSFEKSYDIARQREYPKMHNSRIPKMHNSKIPRNIQSMICIWVRTAIAFLMNQAQNHNAGSCYDAILLAINQHYYTYYKVYINVSQQLLLSYLSFCSCRNHIFEIIQTFINSVPSSLLNQLNRKNSKR